MSKRPVRHSYKRDPESKADITGKPSAVLSVFCAFAFARHVVPTGPAVAVPVQLFAFRELRKKSGPSSRFATEKRASEPEIHSCLWVLFLASSLSTQRRRKEPLICQVNPDSSLKLFAQVPSSFLSGQERSTKQQDS